MMKDPFYIQWHVTNLCNLRCKHCYQDDFSNRSDLDWAGLRRVSDHLFAAMKEWEQKACIHVTGGEPLLKPELFPLLDDLDRQSTVEEVGMITNGLLIDEDAMRRLSSVSKLRKLKISLEGSSALTNDPIRSKGTFEKVMRKISLIKKDERFKIILMFTVMKKNFRSLPLLLKLCQDKGIDGLIIERFIPLGRGREVVNEVLSKEEWKEMIGMLQELFLAEENERSFPPFQAFQVSFGGEEPELSGAPCVIGVDGLSIMPGGIVFPCRRLPISIGNLLETPLKQIWEESEILGKLRRKESLKGKCGNCRINDCRGCRSLAFALTGDYFEEDPHC